MNAQTRKVLQMITLTNAIIFLFALSVLAQNSPASSAVNKDAGPDCVIPIPERIYVWVRLTNPHQQLNDKNFHVTENGHKQELETWQRLPPKNKKVARYKMGYVSTNERQDGKTRKIQVTVLTKDGKQLNIEYWPKRYQAKAIS